MKLIKVQKYAFDLQAVKEFVKNHSEIFTNLPDILELPQPLKNV